MTSDVTITRALGQQQKTAGATVQLAEDFTQFLTLLTTQLQNQDPLNPTDTTEFTNQLVAFTQVEQQINTNQKLDSLVSLGLANAFTGALDYVGMDISYISSELNFDGATPVKVTYALDGIAAKATLNIVDETGETVYSEDVSAAEGGQEYIWDGKLDGGGIAEPGTYEVRINALDTDNKIISSTVVVTGNVRGIETQNGQIFALVGERAVPISQIINAAEPPAPAGGTGDETEETSDTGDGEETEGEDV